MNVADSIAERQRSCGSHAARLLDWIEKMVVRAPLWANCLWLMIVLSPSFGIAALEACFAMPPPVAVFGFLIALGASRLVYTSLIRQTRQRRLQAIYRRHARTCQKGYAIISRSFAQSRDPAFRMSQSIPGLAIPAEQSMFEAVIYYLSEHIPVIAMGNKDLEPDDPAGRALFMPPLPSGEKRPAFALRNESIDALNDVEEAWESIFLTLCQSATFIFVILGVTKGAIREIKLIRDHALGCKAVFYMWPERGHRTDSTMCASASHWENARKAVAEIGIELPRHRAEGGLLVLNDTLSKVAMMLKLPPGNMFSDIIADARFDSGRPLREIAPLICRVEIAADAERYASMWGLDK